MKNLRKKSKIGILSMMLVYFFCMSSCKDDMIVGASEKSDNALVTRSSSSTTTLPFFKGVDLSYANELEDNGVVYTEDGQAKDVYQIMNDHGANLLRVRLWHNPTWTNYSTLADVKISIARAKALNMYVLLDFHYSDTWTDPEQNKIPAAWLPVVDNLPALSDSVSNYTLRILNHLKDCNLLPDLVQIGNETNKNIMVRDTSELEPVNLSRNVTLFNAGINAVKLFNQNNSKSVKTVLHVAMNPSDALNWVVNLNQLNISSFDMLGLSYYPQWQGYTPTELGTFTNTLKTQYNIQLLVAETGHIWTRKWNDNSINLMSKMAPAYPEAPCPQLQKDFLIEVKNAVRNNGGAGVIAWAPEWVSASNVTLWGVGSNWENVTFFDFNNQLIKPGGVEFLSETNVAVTFNVNMAGVNTSNGVYITGEFTLNDDANWQIIPMKRIGTTSVYAFTTYLNQGQSGAYYFLNDSTWSAKESIPQACQLKWGSRLYTISQSSTQQTITNTWSSCN